VGNLGVHPEGHACSSHVVVIGMSVAEGWRGLGVGGVLLETAAGWAATVGVSKLTLGVFPENLRAIHFYERHGFVREGMRRAQYARAGRYHDEMLMARFLTTSD
jgi:L-phenylalanine/L-methionine N-acetyltransferase